MISFHLLLKTDNLICHFQSCKWGKFALIDPRNDNPRCEEDSLDQIKLPSGYNKNYFKNVLKQAEPLAMLYLMREIYCLRPH